MTSTSTHNLVDRLARCMIRLNELSNRHPDQHAWTAKTGDAWSPQEILAHVRASDDILSPRILQVLVRHQPPLSGFDEVRWQEVMKYSDHPANGLIVSFTVRRGELLHALRGVSEADWNRTGTHETRGALSVRQIVEHMVHHEDEHLAELERLLS